MKRRNKRREKGRNKKRNWEMQMGRKLRTKGTKQQ
jgi:hypothetical protein